VQQKPPKQRQRRQAAPQRSRWRGRAHRHMRAKRSSVHGQGARDIRRERRMLCVSVRFVAWLRLRRPEQREQLHCPVRLHQCGGGCDQSARWRRIRRMRGEHSAGTGAPASLLERLLACRALPDWLTSWPLVKGMRRLGRQRETRYGQNTARIRDSAIWILRVDISIDAADVYVEALNAPWT
jgi:hypothetical protein